LELGVMRIVDLYCMLGIGCGSRCGCSCWHSSFRGLMRLTTAVLHSLALLVVSLGEFIRWLKSIEKKLKVQWRKSE
ncbi:hypothetical protein, partial [Escherichia coli]|uniref:hypothetical protein n=1 Tax=Escherichia coli TaxID=562 RepID=UPI001BC85639